MGSSASSAIRQKVKKLVQSRGIKKTKLGEILGKGKDETPQQKFLRASRFLNGDAEIKIDAVMKLARFFEKPLEYFFEGLDPAGLNLASSEKQDPKRLQTIEEIEQRLRSLNLDEKFIREQIQQLRDMEGYGSSSSR